MKEYGEVTNTTGNSTSEGNGTNEANGTRFLGDTSSRVLEEEVSYTSFELKANLTTGNTGILREIFEIAENVTDEQLRSDIKT
jgi:hypothetical protein